MNLTKLKEMNVDRILDLDEAVALSAEARSMETEYATLGMQPPEWLDRASTTLREEIAKRTRAADLAALKAVEAELESLKTASERKADAASRLAALQKKLGMAPAKAGK